MMEGREPIEPSEGLGRRVIFTFWTGVEPLSDQRRAALARMPEVTECDVVLVTAADLPRWVMPEAPLHPAYPFLSAVHRADYLRSYFMQHYGGGYSDVKPARVSWQSAFTHLERCPECWVVGYREVSPDAVAHVADAALYQELRRQYASLPGNGAYVCRPGSPLTTAWVTRVHEVLDQKVDQLRAYPAPHARASRQEDARYALGWTEICGDIFHPLCLEHLEHVATSLTPPDFSNYQ